MPIAYVAECRVVRGVYVSSRRLPQVVAGTVTSRTTIASRGRLERKSSRIRSYGPRAARARARAARRASATQASQSESAVADDTESHNADRVSRASAGIRPATG